MSKSFSETVAELRHFGIILKVLALRTCYGKNTIATRIRSRLSGKFDLA